jgi:uncharacterized protein Usg
MADKDFVKQLTGYSLTTAEILYRIPDHQSLIQSFLWQEYDLHPHFPRLKGFLDFWAKNLDGPLYKIRVAHKKLIHPREFNWNSGEFRLN